MFAFDALFVAVAQCETRTMAVLPGQNTAIPSDNYLFGEFYCVDHGCDCNRVLFRVYAVSTNQCVAVISHSFEPPTGIWDAGDGQTFLDPLATQASFAPDIMNWFLSDVLDDEYAARLRRHYQMVKDAVADPAHPVHDIIGDEDPFEQPIQPRVGERVYQPNEKCPCGSGRKYKKCCGPLG